MTVATAAPSLELYRSVHRITPTLASDGRQVCGHCFIRLWASRGFRWRHDQATIQRLYSEDIARIVMADPVPTYVSEYADDGLGQAKARDEIAREDAFERGTLTFEHDAGNQSFAVDVEIAE